MPLDENASVSTPSGSGLLALGNETDFKGPTKSMGELRTFALLRVPDLRSRITAIPDQKDPYNRDGSRHLRVFWEGVVQVNTLAICRHLS
jgi:hypothetical protein